MSHPWVLQPDKHPYRSSNLLLLGQQWNPHLQKKTNLATITEADMKEKKKKLFCACWMIYPDSAS
jgi:hypothetical protein